MSTTQLPAPYVPAGKISNTQAVSSRVSDSNVQYCKRCHGFIQHLCPMLYTERGFDLWLRHLHVSSSS